MSTTYQEFLNHKAQSGTASGFDAVWMPNYLFPFQQSLVEWAVRKGRAALFEDCGLGKTIQELVFAENVTRKTNKRVLIIAPLAVSHQIAREAEKFGIEIQRSSDGKLRSSAKIVITNYERLSNFDANDYVGCVCDESSILKNFDGSTKEAISVFMRKLPYRLLATATCAPNDYIEVGTSSEALGYLGHVDMLNRFFKNALNNSSTGRFHGKKAEWRFKGHAEDPFWRWMVSWARAMRKPSDMGFSDQKFTLPKLIETNHVIESRTLADGMLFALPATDIREQREERRRTLRERCEAVVPLTENHDSSLVWCHLNAEGDLLADLIPGSEQVSGDDSDDRKEEMLIAFASGQLKRLVTKPKIAGMGMNFQRCAHVVTFPSHSFESYYQSVRRCWRFGQTRPVTVDIVSTEGEVHVLSNMQRKERQAERMFDRLVAHMTEQLEIARGVEFTKEEEVIPWLF